MLEAADTLGAHYFSIYRLIQRGKLKTCRALRGKLLVPRTELLKLLQTDLRQIMNRHEKPTPLQEQAYTEAKQHFAEHLKQFRANCDAVHDIESNLLATANDACIAALQSSGHVIQTDDGTRWQHAVDLTKITSVCHRRTSAGLEFAVVECLPFKSGEMKDVLNRGHDAREVLDAFAQDQREVLNLWKSDVTAQVREQLEEKYPHQDMSIVAESFDIKLARDIARRETLAQNQSHGIRV